MQLSELVSYLDHYLSVRDVPDAPNALNGLQVENAGTVTRMAAAVDVCEATVRLAATQGAELLLVHHGLFWGGLRPLAGPFYRRVAGLLRHDIALYSAHLPLAVALRGEFGEEYGIKLGVWGEVSVEREVLRRRIGALLGVVPRVLAFGPERVQRVGIVTGAGGSLIPQAAAAGLDTYITGEGSHHTFFDAEELGVNVIYAGHYATETVGVKALAEHVSAKFQLPWTFLDHPTGL